MTERLADTSSTERSTWFGLGVTPVPSLYGEGESNAIAKCCISLAGGHNRECRSGVGLAPGVYAEEEGGGHKPPGVGEDTSPGNNLASPVIWAEDTVVGVRPVLRGTGPQTEDLTLDADPAASVIVDGDQLFVQKTLNEWQSENADASALTGLPTTDVGKLPVTFVDWGDNLEAKDWRTGMHVRVETKMLQDVAGLTDLDPADANNAAGMTGYTMRKVSGQGQDEQWGVLAMLDASIWHAVAAQVLRPLSTRRRPA